MKELVPPIGTFLIICSIILIRRYYSALAKKYGKIPNSYTAIGIGLYVAGFIAMAGMLVLLGPYISKGYDVLHLAAMLAFAGFCPAFAYFRLKRHLEDGNPKNDELLDR